MENTELLQIEPSLLRFHFQLKEQSSCSVHLVNKTTDYVAFKVLTNSPKKYYVKPNKGIIKPHGTCEVTVTMQSQPTALFDFQFKDKFLIQSAVASSDDILSKNSDNKLVEKKMLRVSLLPPNRDLKQDDRIQVGMTTGWFKTTNPNNFCVIPNIGIIAPQGTCDVTVTMQAQYTAPLDFQFKNKFLIQSTVASPDDIFSKNSGGNKHVEEKKLRAVLLVPPYDEIKRIGSDQSPLTWSTRIIEPIRILFMKHQNDNAAQQLSLAKNIEELKKDVEEMKSKMSVMDLKLREMEAKNRTISSFAS
ncbi:vesicle-associated protein 1-3-like [Lotus japonicus]|uniref:vesicle-associated protein 1-3-like n=1 Tax=Lotus japonicus TaxID=34305 RepID=UPI0025882B5B|nr:vesicle-associated protein 1-3-like [Lotus japonicus]